MAIKMRILQTFDPAHEKAFLDLERKFAELEEQAGVRHARQF